MIAFIGSVFSPYYYWRGRRDPFEHCAINIALYGPGVGRWSMTERGRRSIEITPALFKVGPSQLALEGSELILTLDERAAPVPKQIRGRICLKLDQLADCAVSLNHDASHRWWPIAPTAPIAVDLDQPDLSWRGGGYLDTNAGDVPLERDFQVWDWSRAHLKDGSAILYDVAYRRGGSMCLGLKFDRAGNVREFAAPPKVSLPTPFWRVRRHTRSERPATLLDTFEDSPFYARSLIRSQLFGETVTSVHESLDLERFSSPVVKMMLPFRMPRRA